MTFQFLQVKPIIWQTTSLKLIDQRLLPQQEIYVECLTYQEVIVAIQEMIVRGAPAIGISGAYAVVLAASYFSRLEKHLFLQSLYKSISEIEAARPTAVNLQASMTSMRNIIKAYEKTEHTPEEVNVFLEKAASLIHEDDAKNNVKMASFGLEAILSCEDNTGTASIPVMTHCNTGALATAGLGTALGVIRFMSAQGCLEQVFVNETRPWMQGNRLTVWEMEKENIPYQLICDSAAAFVMKKFAVKWLVVGADRITANGDVANKIGTYALAIAAKYHGVKVMVVAPRTTWDLSIESGEDIPIEERDMKELVQWRQTEIGLAHARGYNPVFDVTPHELINVLVCEEGCIWSPNAEKISAFFQ